MTIILTPLANRFCRKAECPPGPRPSIAFGNFAFSFASSSFSNSLGYTKQKEVWVTIEDKEANYNTVYWIIL